MIAVKRLVPSVFVIVASVGLSMGVPKPTSAHHSTTIYDLTKKIELAGTVARFQWTNPHSWIDVEVLDEDGKTTIWAIEFGAPNLNYRAGWRRDDVKVGDKVSVVIYPSRSGSAHGTLATIILSDGRTLSGAADFVRRAAQQESSGGQ